MSSVGGFFILRRILLYPPAHRRKLWSKLTGLRWLLVLFVLFPGLGACVEVEQKGFQTSAVTTSPAETLAAPTPSASPAPTPTRTAPPAASPTSRPSSARLPSASPSPTPTATPDSPPCLQQGGSIIHGSLATKLLRTPLVYRVYLPPCYHDFLDQRYPVLYLIHGQGFTDEQWDRIGADEAADQLIAAGEISPLIIVMPYERYGGQPTESGFAQALVEVLVPHIDATYRTRPTAQARAVGGLSRGGGWAIHFGLVYWEIFGALGAHSPAVFHTDAQSMRTLLDAIPPDAMPRIFIDIGDRDRPEILRSAIWFEQLLNEKDIPHEWHLFSGYHNEAYWTEHMPLYLRWYARGW